MREKTTEEFDEKRRTLVPAKAEMKFPGWARGTGKDPGSPEISKGYPHEPSHGSPAGISLDRGLLSVK